ncbi:hypothetical protein EVAR_43815_1 [Eumeta japonica]|uniref:Uncharacterized protein n=1 Tax=Eumeta variegata TaxID=151549 RepID=A0A4C1WYQ3_EUMVA|nr:hypothetical protein EVAR_43815_1 [Eumeta japonica]
MQEMGRKVEIRNRDKTEIGDRIRIKFRVKLLIRTKIPIKNFYPYERSRGQRLVLVGVQRSPFTARERGQPRSVGIARHLRQSLYKAIRLSPTQRTKETAPRRKSRLGRHARPAGRLRTAA